MIIGNPACTHHTMGVKYSSNCTSYYLAVSLYTVFYLSLSEMEYLVYTLTYISKKEKKTYFLLIIFI